MQTFFTVVVSLMLGAGAQGKVTAQLSSAETHIRVEAGRTAPRLVSLRSETGEWRNQVPEKLIDRVRIGQKVVPVSWQFNARESNADGHRVVYVYDSKVPRLRLSWEWAARAVHGPIEHVIRIQNLGTQALWIPLQDSFRFDWRIMRGRRVRAMYVEKGADTPSNVGTHNVDVADGFTWHGMSSTYAHPFQNRPREIIPWLAVNAGDNESGWYVGIEFSGRTRLALRRKGGSLSGEVGLNPAPGPFWSRVPAQGTFQTPIVFVGAFNGNFDAAGNILRRWVKEVLGNPRTWQNEQYPLTVNNSWGSGTHVDEELALKMIADSKELGLEMFHMDAGWFRAVGDWYPDPKKFPRGLAVVADAAHGAGLKFGLWVDWAQAGLSTSPGALNARDPKVQDWLVTDLPPDWKPEEFKGQTIDIGNPVAHNWTQAEVERIVRDYHLDMLEHDGYLVAQGCVRKDHPHAPPDFAKLGIHKDSGFYFVESTNSTDVSYHAVRSYYAIHSKLRDDHPGLLLEVCNDGGRMVDFGSAAHGDYFSITDTYDPLSNRRAFYDTSQVLPAAMLESYVEKWPSPTIENFLYMLRSGMMGWVSIMQDTAKWSPEQRAAAKEEIQLYKTRLRPLIRNADLYHISARPDGIHWDAIEYFDTKSRQGVLYAFHGSDQAETTYSFVLQGLRADRKYKLTFHDRSSPDTVASGRALMGKGLNVSLPAANSSELVFIDEAD
jgi:disulfide oxidoreductase YuzD